MLNTHTDQSFGDEENKIKAHALQTASEDFSVDNERIEKIKKYMQETTPIVDVTFSWKINSVYKPYSLNQ